MLHRLLRLAGAKDSSRGKWPCTNAKDKAPHGRSLARPLPAAALGEGKAPSVAGALGPLLDDSSKCCECMRLPSGVNKAISLCVLRYFGPRIQGDVKYWGKTSVIVSAPNIKGYWGNLKIGLRLQLLLVSQTLSGFFKKNHHHHLFQKILFSCLSQLPFAKFPRPWWTAVNCWVIAIPPSQTRATWMCKPMSGGCTRNFLRPLPAWIIPCPCVFMDENERTLIGPAHWRCLGCAVDAQVSLQGMWSKSVCVGHGSLTVCTHVWVRVCVWGVPKSTGHLPISHVWLCMGE